MSRNISSVRYKSCNERLFFHPFSLQAVFGRKSFTEADSRANHDFGSLQAKKISLQSPLHKTTFSLQIYPYIKTPANQLPDLIGWHMRFFPLQQRLPEQCLWLFRKTLLVAEISFLNPCNEQREPKESFISRTKNPAKNNWSV